MLVKGVKMKLLIQRVKNSNVKVDNKIIGNINKGLLVFVGITHNDTKQDIEKLCKKMCKLRIFEDENNKMNLSIKDIEGELLVVSQFTLYADCSNGNRPSFTNAAKPEFANELYEYFIECCKKEVNIVKKGCFGAHMEISLINDGPVTIMLEN